MFEIKVVESCPYSRGSQAMVHIPHDILAEFAGAVHKDDLEWLALLKGKRSKDGMVTYVEKLVIPPQYRHASICGLDGEMAIDPEIVGVVHSHHSFGAFFSNIDVTTFNTRFPLSIVIARVKKWRPRPGSELFGFEYEAEARTILPCNDLGITKVFIVPSPLPPNWCMPTKAVSASDHGGLGDCENQEVTRKGTHRIAKATCGASTGVHNSGMFGSTGEGIMNAVNKVGRIIEPERRVFKWNGSGFTFTDKRHHAKVRDNDGTVTQPHLSKKERKRRRRLGIWPFGSRPESLDTDQRDLQAVTAQEEAGLRTPTRMCTYCYRSKLDYEVHNWKSFPQKFLDGTGVCNSCCDKQPDHIGEAGWESKP